jgi:RNA polymerase sigma factor (sigma-70 family)
MADLGEVVVAEAKALRGYIARRVRGDTGAVQDLLQAALMQMIAYNAKRGPLGRDELVRILYTIAHRRVVDWYDRVDNLLLCPSDDVLLTEAAVEAAMDLVDSVAARVDIQRALERLSPQQQRALVLVYLDGLDRRTAAAVMGISVDGVKKHLAGAKARARQLDELAGYGRSQGEVSS